MARIDIKSAGATLNDGVLQLENGVAMDTTLRNVADQNNTTSPLLLSTTAVQVTSPLRITTSDASGFYLDAEDSATNNRFSIKRDPSAQEVTLDFASNPSGSTTLVGAIRTYRDGVNLSNAMSFIEDGSVGIGTSAPVGILHLYKSAAATRLAIDGDAGQNRLISYRTGALQRFGLYVNNTAESGSNAGSNFAIRAYSDAGALLTTPFFINRATGNVGVNTLTGTAKLQVVGSGSTSATTSLLVQNSSASDLFKITDNGQVSIPPINASSISNLVINAGSLTQSTAVGIDLVGGQFAAQLYLRALGTTTAGYPSAILGKVLFQALSGLVITTNKAGSLSNTDIALYVYQSKSVHINGFTEVASAILNAESTTKGFLPPRMTTAQKNLIATPAAGLMVYDTTLNKLCVYTGAGWETITSI